MGCYEVHAPKLFGLGYRRDCLRRISSSSLCLVQTEQLTAVILCQNGLDCRLMTNCVVGMRKMHGQKNRHGSCSIRRQSKTFQRLALTSSCANVLSLSGQCYLPAVVKSTSRLRSFVVNEAYPTANTTRFLMCTAAFDKYINDCRPAKKSNHTILSLFRHTIKSGWNNQSAGVHLAAIHNCTLHFSCIYANACLLVTQLVAILGMRYAINAITT